MEKSMSVSALFFSRILQGPKDMFNKNIH